ncbi:MAG: endo-1,4-beta-xylanase [Chloroflexus sp.]|uniref:endo-1,4-beta-xylanase n=1 Tax=Chloroflexus sp. TaxID=1904827 RepID=UPI003D10C8C5
MKVFSVVNEPYHLVGNREDVLLKIIGPEYIKIAFETARNTAPDAILVLSETSNHDNRPWGGAFTKQTRELAQSLKEEGLVDWIGVQGHLAYSHQYPYPSIETMVNIFNSYGDVMITELDVNLSAVASPDRYLFQAEGYRRLIIACLQANSCHAINLWGAFPDSNSWYERGLGQPNADATPWDDSAKPKVSYYVILNVLYSHLLTNK